MRTLLLSVIAQVVAVASVQSAEYRSRNFVVVAPSAEIAQRVACDAELHRRGIAVLWTGRELPPWSSPSSLRVLIAESGHGGSSTFTFDRGRVVTISIQVQGSADRILSDVLPHEVTHCVLATYFGRPLPRWCDEGIATLAEGQAEQQRLDRAVRDRLNAGKAIPLSRLFALREYPDDISAVYSQGNSVVTWLIGLDREQGRSRLLGFVRDGSGNGDWSASAKRWYGLCDVPALEHAWLDHLKATKGQPLSTAATVACGSGGGYFSWGVGGGYDRYGPLQDVIFQQQRQQFEIQNLQQRVDRLERRGDRDPFPYPQPYPMPYPYPPRNGGWDLPPMNPLPRPTPYPTYDDCPDGRCPLPSRR